MTAAARLGAAPLLLAAAAAAAAPPLPTSEELGLYYTLGGARAVPPSPGDTLRVKLLPDFQVGGGYSCGKFDFRHQVQDILGRLEEQLLTLKALPKQYLLALPGGLFCRAFPGACQLMQYYTVRAGEAFKVALRSCEELEQSIAGGGPAAPWKQVAKSVEWSRRAAEEGNVVQARAAAEEAGEEGLAWVGGRRAGGAGQALIRPVYDSGRAGWCLLGRAAADCEEAARDTPARRLFGTPEAVGAWLVDVVGEQAISTAAGTASPTIAGHGLLPLIEAERARIRARLDEMLRTDPVQLEEADLAAVSSRNLVMHREVIDGLQAKPDARWRVERLASELATARVVEKAFVARAALLAGRQEPHVAALGPARAALDGAFARLNHQIDFVLKEARDSHRLASETIRTFIEYETLSQALNPIRLRPPDAMDSSLRGGGFPRPAEE